MSSFEAVTVEARERVATRAVAKVPVVFMMSRWKGRKSVKVEREVKSEEEGRGFLILNEIECPLLHLLLFAPSWDLSQSCARYDVEEPS